MIYTEVVSFDLNGVQIKTTVTNELKVLDEHISSFLQPTDNNRTKVIGFDMEWRPPFMLEPAIFQLCDGNSCLIFHLHPKISVPLSLRNFLRQPNYTFVGCGIKDDFEYLKKHSGIGCKNAVELGTLAATLMDKPHLGFCGVDELAFVVNKLDLHKYRPLNLAFDWDSYPLSEELAKLATVNVYSYHKIGSALFERYSRDKTQKDSNGSEVTVKKYSRDFLLKFAEQYSEVPEGFETTADIAEPLMVLNIGSRVMGRDTHPFPGRNTD
ncbi:werner syndrome-like exonuclease-like protein, partial [Trifolium pratense]